LKALPVRDKTDAFVSQKARLGGVTLQADNMQDNSYRHHHHH
jgi:hypothetical protein